MGLYYTRGQWVKIRDADVRDAVSRATGAKTHGGSPPLVYVHGQWRKIRVSDVVDFARNGQNVQPCAESLTMADKRDPWLRPGEPPRPTHYVNPQDVESYERNKWLISVKEHPSDENPHDEMRHRNETWRAWDKARRSDPYVVRAQQAAEAAARERRDKAVRQWRADPTRVVEAAQQVARCRAQRSGIIPSNASGAEEAAAIELLCKSPPSGEITYTVEIRNQVPWFVFSWTTTDGTAGFERQLTCAERHSPLYVRTIAEAHIAASPPDEGTRVETYYGPTSVLYAWTHAGKPARYYARSDADR